MWQPALYAVLKQGRALVPLTGKHTTRSSNVRDRRHQKWNTTTVGDEKKERGKKKNIDIYQISFVLNMTETFSAADNSPRFWKNRPLVITHFPVISPFLNISKEQYNIFLH